MYLVFWYLLRNNQGIYNEVNMYYRLLYICCSFEHTFQSFALSAKYEYMVIPNTVNSRNNLLFQIFTISII